MISRRVELIDTSVLIDLLDLPNEAHDHAGRVAEADRKRDRGVQFMLPVASVIECGQHIQRVINGHSRRTCAVKFEHVLQQTAEGVAPWTLTPLEWNSEFLNSLLEQRPPFPASLVEGLAQSIHEMGDLTIIAELRRVRANLNYVTVDVWTLDQGLRTAVDSL